MRIGCERNLLGAVRVDRIEALAATLEEDTDKIDDYLSVARRRFHRRCVSKVGLHRMDLTDTTKRLQVAGKLGTAHRHPDAVMTLGQSANHVPAEET
jgi:hypothetical protein